MTPISGVEIELSVVIGRRTMPINHLLRMGRGAVIELEANVNDEVEILANMVPIGRGEVIVEGDRITVEITQKYKLSDMAA
jgi:flagellar motor switch protein FliN/FliY